MARSAERWNSVVADFMASTNVEVLDEYGFPESFRAPGVPGFRDAVSIANEIRAKRRRR